MADTAGEVDQHLSDRVADLRDLWDNAQPFPHVVIDDFLPEALADHLADLFPGPTEAGWNDTDYIHQRHKLTRTSGFPEDVERFFEVTESDSFVNLIAGITGVRGIVTDPARLGGGCHQITRGGFLDVHVDFNRHPVTGLRRRLNLLIYMNREWRPEWRGHLELWGGQPLRMVHSIEPVFNRAVLFETGETSYHGHPTPFTPPAGQTRKSMAVYYYTADDPEGGPEHNTIYRQTTGLGGYVKTARATGATTLRHLRQTGLRGVATRVAAGTIRRVKGSPPPNA